VATEENLTICDLRAVWNVKKFSEDANCKNVNCLKFDPFDNNRFAALSQENLKIFDLRNRKRPLFILKD